MDVLHYLSKYKNLTVEEAIKIETEKQDERVRDQLEKQIQHNSLIDSILEQRYYKIVHNSSSISYVEIINRDLKSNSISFYKERIQIEERPINYLWFASNSSTSVKKITKEQYEEVKSSSESFIKKYLVV